MVNTYEGKVMYLNKQQKTEIKRVCNEIIKLHKKLQQIKNKKIIKGEFYDRN